MSPPEIEIAVDRYTHMRTLFTTLLIAFSVFAKAQNSSTFLKHDTVTLKAAYCNWLIPPQPKPAKQMDANTVAEWYLQAIRQGKIKATDPETGTAIPADKILTWNMTDDTMEVFDDNGESSGYRVLLAEINPSQLSAIKIQQDWYMDVSTGKLSQKIRWIQLMKEVYAASGMFLGYTAFCRIYY